MIDVIGAIEANRYARRNFRVTVFAIKRRFHGRGPEIIAAADIAIGNTARPTRFPRRMWHAVVKRVCG